MSDEQDEMTHDQLRYAFKRKCAELKYYQSKLPVDARFKAACAALQSVSCGIIAEQKNRGSAAESLVESALEIADALLAALSGETGK